MNAPTKPKAPRRKRQTQIDATRARLVQHARTLFRKQGYKGASIGQLIAQAGGSKETIYRHFRSKDELLKAVFDAELADYLAAAEPLMKPPPADVRVGLTDLSVALLLELTSERSISLHQIFAGEARGRPLVARHYYRDYVRKGHEIGRRFLEQYQASGDLNKMLDSRSLTEYFGSMLLYESLLKRQFGMTKPMRPAEAKRLATRFVTDFLDAFGTDRASRSSRRGSRIGDA